MVTVAVDMMGSDLGPEELSKGILDYLHINPEIHFICFGDPDRLDLLKDQTNVEIVKTTQVVPMETGTLGFLRLKDSSMYQAIQAVKDGKAQAIVTAGSTGGFLTGSTLLLKNIAGVRRAGFCSPFPTAIKGKSTAILDVGASNVNTAEELVGFAKLGSLYSKYILGVDNPAVYLLSNGAEEGKGLDESKAAYQILKNDPTVNFKGNAEARDVLDGKRDVVVTSGYPGNIFLKATEGAASMVGGLVKKAFKRSFISKIGYLFVRKGIKEMQETMNYKKTGGAILLGINGVAIKTHGNSDAEFFSYSLDLAYKMVKCDIVGKIKDTFKEEK
jgi:glycerol-3-phosphate acyltransferase PlsX